MRGYPQKLMPLSRSHQLFVMAMKCLQTTTMKWLFVALHVNNYNCLQIEGFCGLSLEQYVLVVRYDPTAFAPGFFLHGGW